MRGLGSLRAYVAGFLMTAGLSLTAFDAQAIRYDNIDVVVKPTPATLSYGAPGSYQFYIANLTNGSINTIRFRATLSAGEFALTNPIGSGASATCTRVDPQNLDCSITGGVVSYGYSTFDFAFTAPPSGGPVSLSWNVRFGQGESTTYITGGGGSNPSDIALITNSSTEAEAYIPPTGFNLYTGTAVPSPGDSFTVNMLINPASNRVITGAITESPTSTACTQQKCVQLGVLKKITDTTNGDQTFAHAVYTEDESTTDLSTKLITILRVDASELKGKRIRQATLFYTNDLGNRSQIGACASLDPSYAPGPTEPPCLARAVEYTKRTAPTPELIGDWEFELWSSRNGFVDVGY